MALNIIALAACAVFLSVTFLPGPRAPARVGTIGQDCDVMNILEVKDLRIDIPMRDGILHAVRGVSFAVPKGGTLCLVGESGSGKSLSALSIIGLLPHKGQRRVATLQFDGRDISGLKERQLEDLRGREIAVVFQDPMVAFDPTMTIGSQLEEVYLRHVARDRRMARAKALDLLTRVGVTMPDMRLKQYPHELSGGLRQRAMIAMALMSEPKLLIADEPTTALDVTMQVRVLALLQDLQAEFGISILFITHDLGVVAAIADQVAVMRQGQVVEAGSVDDVLLSPREDYTKALLAAVPEVPVLQGLTKGVAHA